MNLTDKLNNISKPKLKKIAKGKATNIKDFWDYFVEPLLPDVDIVIQWNTLLNNYIKSPNPTFAIRGYNSAAKKEYSNLRRGFLTNTNDDYSFFYTDNFFAAYFCKMAIDGFVPELDEFIYAFRTRKFPSRFGQDTAEERELMAINRGKDPYIQSSGYKIAHIIPVGKEYAYNGEVINITQILNKYFPAGERNDWKLKTDSIGDFYERDLKVDPIAKKYIIAHFLRFVHPLNYFLAPKKNLEKNCVCKEIAEYPGLLEYAKYRMHLKYGTMYDDYLKLIMANDLKFTDETACEVIDIEWDNIPFGNTKLTAKKVSSYPLPHNIKSTGTSSVKKKITARKVSKPVPAKKEKSAMYPDDDIKAMVYEFLTNPKSSYRKLQKDYLKIDSPSRGGGYEAMEILKEFGILSEHKGILKNFIERYGSIK